jgi:MoCo/4Fe-4S cofactor protein with predicted Tat translocation signal
MAHDKDNQNLPQAVDTPGQPTALQLEELQQELSAARGKEYWQTLEEMTGRPGFDELMEREFPQHASEWLDPVSRRGFLKLAGASLALAGLSACTKQPWEGVVPYVKQPEDLIPSKAKYYATVMPMPTGALPLLVKSNEFRPTKIEGNPDHPASMGASDVYSQASVLGLYDPDRSQTITFEGQTRGWGTFQGAIHSDITRQRAKGGAGLRFLSGTNISPSFSALMKQTLAQYPQAKWIQYEPVNRDNVRAGYQMAFGRPAEPQYNLEAADVIVSLDADFLSGAQFPGFIKYARQYAMKRKGAEGINRLYVIESTMSTTGGKADHRLPLRASEVEHAAAYIANALGASVSGVKSFDAEQKKYLDALVKDLQAHHGKAVVIAGEYQSPATHALAVQINQAIGAVGQTVNYTDPVETDPQQQTVAFQELRRDMDAGKVELLVILGQNVAYASPRDFYFEDTLKAYIDKGGMAVHLGLYKDETSRYCQWHINEAHYLESWGDARTVDGTVSIVQPLIEPLYAGKTELELVALFGDNPGASAYNLVQQYWNSQGFKAAGATGDFETEWRKALHNGFVANSASTAKYTSSAKPPITLTPVSSEMELIFRPDPNLFDGRFSNNAWLQELAKPVSKMSWDNAILVDVRTAAEKKWEEGDVIEITTKAGKIELPVLKMPGHAPYAMTVYLGFGRTHAGRVGTGVGRNAYLLRASDAQWTTTPSKLEKKGSNYAICVSRSHNYKDAGKHNGEIEQFEGQEAVDRGLVRVLTVADLVKGEENASEKVHEHFAEPSRNLTLYKNFDYSHENQWGMAIDGSTCVGCNACVIACQSENNIATVGRLQQQVGREMLWLRVDTYYTGDVSNPRASFLPIPCMHCENAPCEPVCPVGATVHSPEGLNVMVYNRCVGTRYCNNNCPYKVRRFNFLLYSDFETPSLKLHNNPDVTVRSRGVMEKCTYCVQRITAARIAAEKDGRTVNDGDVETACQQACPTEAITFGNINDPKSKVAQEKRGPRNYAMLASLNTRPRTSYLAGIVNPNPELGDGPLPELKEENLNR